MTKYLADVGFNIVSIQKMVMGNDYLSCEVRLGVSPPGQRSCASGKQIEQVDYQSVAQRRPIPPFIDVVVERIVNVAMAGVDLVTFK